MEISYLKPIYYSYYFKIIEEKLLDWNLQPVDGKGFYRRVFVSEVYDHVELKMYQSINEQPSIAIWDITEKQTSLKYIYKPFVEKY